MELIVRTDEASASELYLWMVDELKELDRESTVELKSIPPTGSMGAMEVLALVIPNALTLGGLIISLMSYRASRQRSSGEAPRVSIGTVENYIAIGEDQAQTLLQLRGAVPAVGEPPDGTAESAPHQ